MGKKLLYSWFLRPLLDLERIAERHDAVAVLSGQLPARYTAVQDGGENQSAADQLQKETKKIKDISNLLRLIKTGRGDYKAWRSFMNASLSTWTFLFRPDLRQSIFAIVEVQDIANEITCADELPIIQKVSLHCGFLLLWLTALARASDER